MFFPALGTEAVSVIAGYLVIPLQEFLMAATDSFSVGYQDLLDGTYDCVDRIVFNGYCPLLCSPGGFRTWWRDV